MTQSNDDLPNEFAFQSFTADQIMPAGPTDMTAIFPQNSNVLIEFFEHYMGII
jgi:hypothetical protein